MTRPELLGWLEFFKHYPTDVDRQDFMLSQLTAVLAESNRDKKRRPKPFVPTDFSLNAYLREAEKTPAQKSLDLKQRLMNWQKRHLPAKGG